MAKGGKTATIKQIVHVTRSQLPSVNAGPGLVRSYFSREANNKRSQCNEKPKHRKLERRPARPN